MICKECDRLDEKYIRPRDERSMRIAKGILTPETHAMLIAEEHTAREAILDHRSEHLRRGEVVEGF
jgi:hypothetical protein